MSAQQSTPAPPPMVHPARALVTPSAAVGSPSSAARASPPTPASHSPASATHNHNATSSSSSSRERIGDYVLGSEIGKGSFAVVYKGYRSASASSSSSSAPTPSTSAASGPSSRRSPVAIKAVSRNKLTPKLLENLEGEISILKAISHENVVRLEDCIVSRGALGHSLAALQGNSKEIMEEN